MGMQYIQKTMKNGVRVFLYPDASKHTVLVDYLILFGGRDRDFWVNGKERHMASGLAHFLEHYIVERSPFGNLLEQFRNHYFQTNAMTEPKATEFYFHGTKELEEGLRMLLDAVDHPVFEEKAIADTKPAIYEEIRMKQDNPWAQFYTRLRKNMFHHLNYEDNLGTIEEVSQITKDDLELCHSVFYRPENKCLLVTGCFDPDQVMQWLECYYNQETWKLISYEAFQVEEPREVVKAYDEIALPRVSPALGIGYKIDVSSLSMEKRKFLRYFSFYLVLKFGQRSPLYQELDERRLIIGGLSSTISYYNDFVSLDVVADTNYPEEVLEIVRKHMKQNDLSEAEFLLEQRAARAGEVVKYDDLGTLNEELVSNLIGCAYGQLDSEEELRDMKFSSLLELIDSLSFDQESVLVMKEEETN